MSLKYFLATYVILDGVHEHTGAVILTAKTAQEAEQLASEEEYEPATDKETRYFSYGGDGTTACRKRDCLEITAEQMEFLEHAGLAYRR